MKAKILKVLSGSNSVFEISVEFIDEGRKSPFVRNIPINFTADNPEDILAHIRTTLTNVVNTHQREKSCITRDEVVKLIDQEIEL